MQEAASNFKKQFTLAAALLLPQLYHLPVRLSMPRAAPTRHGSTYGNLQKNDICVASYLLADRARNPPTTGPCIKNVIHISFWIPLGLHGHEAKLK